MLTAICSDKVTSIVSLFSVMFAVNYLTSDMYTGTSQSRCIPVEDGAFKVL